ncbi:MAG: hypothetical protein P8X61_06260 [Limibacillus sp.]
MVARQADAQARENDRQDQILFVKGLRPDLPGDPEAEEGSVERTHYHLGQQVEQSLEKGERATVHLHPDERDRLSILAEEMEGLRSGVLEGSATQRQGHLAQFEQAKAEFDAILSLGRDLDAIESAGVFTVQRSEDGGFRLSGGNLEAPLNLPFAGSDLRSGLLNAYASGRLSHEEIIEGDLHRLYDDSGSATPLAFDLWAVDQATAAAQPLTDPANFGAANSLVDGLMETPGVENAAAFNGVLSNLEELETKAPDASEAQAFIAANPGLGRKAARGHRGPDVERYEAAQATLAAYEEQAEELAHLQTAVFMARVVEIAGAEEVRDHEFDVVGSAAQGAVVNAAFAVRSMNPAAILGTAVLGALGNAGEAVAGRLAASEVELKRLPEMLREDPEAAATLMASIAGAQDWGRIAGHMLSVGRVGQRLGFEGSRNALRILSEEAGAAATNEILK